MNGQERIDERRRRQAGRRGFTLIELLVVMLIILLVSAVVLPTVLPAISHRQVSEAARILQGALAGARDTAINNNAPAGIRLLPDPVLNGQSINALNGAAATLDPTKILASNRYIPIQLAPDYSEGLVNVDLRDTPTSVSPLRQIFPYPCSERRRLLSRGNRPDALRRAVGLQTPQRQPAQLADLLVLEHPDWRQDPAQQHGNLVHRRRPHEHLQPRAVRQHWRSRGDASPPEDAGERHELPTRSSSSWSTAWTTTRTATWTTAGTASTTMETGSLTKSPTATTCREWVEIETWQGSILNVGTIRTSPTPSLAGRWCRRAPARRRCHRTWWST